jgi:hypothetical protein
MADPLSEDCSLRARRGLLLGDRVSAEAPGSLLSRRYNPKKIVPAHAMLECFVTINENHWNIVGVLPPQFGVCVDVHLTPLELGLVLSIGESVFNDLAEMAAMTRIHNYIVHIAIVNISCESPQFAQRN